MNTFSWTGSKETYVDEAFIKSLDEIVIGLYGGNSAAGQYKNEDGCLVWSSPGEWEFIMILDGHDTAESVELVIRTFEKERTDLTTIIEKPGKKAFSRLHDFIIETFSSDTFKEEAMNVQGETACLFALRKGKYLWWLSIGDCLLHLFHPELSVMGEYQQNHRSFYEWVGKNSTFNHEVPTYSTGIKELRAGENQIFLTTDGLTECPGTSFHDPKMIMGEFTSVSLEGGVRHLIGEIQRNNVRDSTTIITWKVGIEGDSTLPSDF
ncbi:protein phosphatase 2C domain-containing protein [Rossellomorea aquimaris]|uniref:protein phosphatase 2C domain-containing protein n=1 Tax=Rossellomorea aquimaris TaxID=189382 RepID=UPI001CD35FC5|nr:protein phosphatase 2C domain-containing protein [Rossellomorea aquimaris]MCA1053739.1 protein phosphatase 2C domain-containing protein [Rossellomorea aquimaris]